MKDNNLNFNNELIKKKIYQHLKYKTKVNFKGIYTCTVQRLRFFKKDQFKILGNALTHFIGKS